MMHKKGFTLIEVVVVIAIIGIASSIILVSIGNGRTRQQVEGDARRLAGIVRELQNNALAGKQIVPGQVTCAFSLPAAAVGATTLTPRYFYRNGSSCGSALSAVLPAFRFSPGVAISVANGGIRFAVPWGKVWNGSATTEVTTSVAYTFAKSGVTWSVCVYGTGRVEEVVGATCP